MANNKIVATAVACAIAACAVGLLVAWRLDYLPHNEARPTDEQGGTAETTKPSAPTADLVAVGDIAEASAESVADNRVARIIERQHRDAVVAALGDLAYESGTLPEFDTYYHDADPNTLYSWGADLNERVKPVPGNHEYYTPNARGYVDYFTAHGVQIGDPSELWYAYDVPGTNWRAIALNSERGGTMGYGDEQHKFLREGLRAAKAAEKNTVLYMHLPFYSSGCKHGWRESTEENRLPCSAPTYPAVRPLWNLAVKEGGDLILAAHTHAYERFEPIKEGGAVGPGGVPSFVVGTGGNARPDEPGDAYPNDWNGDCGPFRPQSAFYDHEHYGALVLDLRADGFGYAFQAADGTTVDSGTMGVR
jgi:hypothetical protein